MWAGNIFNVPFIAILVQFSYMHKVTYVKVTVGTFNLVGY